MLVFSSLLNSRVIRRLTQTSGANTTTIICRDRTVKGTSFCQYTAPSVLGMISDRNRMAAVIAAGTASCVIHGAESAQICEA